jgi:hypothetical protein
MSRKRLLVEGRRNRKMRWRWCGCAVESFSAPADGDHVVASAWSGELSEWAGVRKPLPGTCDSATHPAVTQINSTIIHLVAPSSALFSVCHWWSREGRSNESDRRSSSSRSMVLITSSRVTDPSRLRKESGESVVGNTKTPQLSESYSRTVCTVFRSSRPGLLDRVSFNEVTACPCKPEVMARFVFLSWRGASSALRPFPILHCPKTPRVIKVQS